LNDDDRYIASSSTLDCNNSSRLTSSPSGGDVGGRPSGRGPAGVRSASASSLKGMWAPIPIALGLPMTFFGPPKIATITSIRLRTRLLTFGRRK
jgi:hypothetical protein